jgi:hypothetical protein
LTVGAGHPKRILVDRCLGFTRYPIAFFYGLRSGCWFGYCRADKADLAGGRMATEWNSPVIRTKTEAPKRLRLIDRLWDD